MVCLSEGMTLTTQLKPMTTSNITANNKTGIKQAASLVAMAVAPLAIVMGVAAMSVPSAEARVGMTNALALVTLFSAIPTD